VISTGLPRPWFNPHSMGSPSVDVVMLRFRKEIYMIDLIYYVLQELSTRRRRVTSSLSVESSQRLRLSGRLLKALAPVGAFRSRV